MCNDEPKSTYAFFQKHLKSVALSLYRDNSKQIHGHQLQLVYHNPLKEACDKLVIARKI